MPTALILGAGSDMAVAIARHYAGGKYDLQLAARNVDSLYPLQQDLQIRYHIKAESFAFDATDFDSHAAFYAGLPVKPDITICVFGYLGEQEKAQSNWSEAARIIHTNFTGAVSILNIVADDYAAKGTGTIVGISSVAGERGRQSNYIYGSSKAGFTTYLSGLRNRLFHKGVHVLTVKPGFVYTRMTEHLKMPPLLTAQPQAVAKDVYKAAVKKKNVLYTKWFWRYIMLIIKSIPEGIFKKLKL
ncbi:MULTISPECIES: SDR family oxidoreductase [unclassified Chitinophaga]|uniref:SDR family oxidoreductase n=1 Tax=unclassified Chitinophaga TaxID=2619133 RepID=UPI0009CEF4DD|nr:MULTISPECIES: SDR family oxidoreductase [unclassified Chitinophaga]OMP78738.1 short-chain dehydrogenase [[Flexibacter] sp. ATCC 35208]WPV64983.1 SDR family oxidoreductase [Chitinophaga sp. LS1]